MNFHHDSVAATVRLGSRRCQARRLTRSFRQSPTEHRSRHPSQYPERRSSTARFGSGDCPVRLPALPGQKAGPELSAKSDRAPQSPSEPRSVSDAGIIVWRCGTFAATDHQLLITDH